MLKHLQYISTANVENGIVRQHNTDYCGISAKGYTSLTKEMRWERHRPVGEVDPEKIVALNQTEDPQQFTIDDLSTFKDWYYDGPIVTRSFPPDEPFLPTYIPSIEEFNLHLPVFESHLRLRTPGTRLNTPPRTPEFNSRLTIDPDEGFQHFKKIKKGKIFMISTSVGSQGLGQATQLLITVTPRGQSELFVQYTPLAWQVFDFALGALNESGMPQTFTLGSVHTVNRHWPDETDIFEGFVAFPVRSREGIVTEPAVMLQVYNVTGYTPGQPLRKADSSAFLFKGADQQAKPIDLTTLQDETSFLLSSGSNGELSLE
ncbi:hypothetical protein NLI96_g8799 [Meripilus lineatus]|uniref:Uncharacterized protein n=1 Tax=Meripilus lineatus TaxID=2056292 RepID=A0AAD5V1B1_9APHY|nr:hypothetical protein NLI96_g8799 [Physisporinus lineatus]